MNRISLPRTSLAVSPLCLGTAFFGADIDQATSFALLDRFVERGGNFIDTARIYSDWAPGERHRSERLLGDWLETRGHRSSLVIATKGAHPELETPTVPRSSAAEIRTDLEGSLRSLRVDAVDVYWLHRDDPSRPVEHFIDLLNAFLREGLIRSFGASNWTADRLRAAHDYAQRSGQKGFVANQPLWSLGSRHAHPSPIHGLVRYDPAAHAFHHETGLAVIPYSSQASGFFSKLALPADRRPPGLGKHAFHTPPNIAAGEIVARLAEEKGVAPSAIVLAYLWSRSFPVVPIVGCRTIEQLDDSIRAVPVRLTDEERQALETASDSGLT
ncbi:MAG TPA: aldo/keto reductase [Opitutus sp.]|nr:aldo/keto reductase [Opitutus sp.]